MDEREQAPGGTGGEPGKDADGLDAAHEAALMREVMREQEEHREGGVEPGLDGGDAAAEPG